MQSIPLIVYGLRSNVKVNGIRSGADVNTNVQRGGGRLGKAHGVT